MTTGAALLAVAALLALNGFFVLAEFALVKFRPTRVEALIDEGNVRARAVQRLQARLDDYLSLCQVGITLASIGLGFVGEPAFAALVEPWLGSWAWAHAVSIWFSYLVVSFLHILLGEQVPKMLAIRAPEGSALWVAPWLPAVRAALYLPLAVLRGATNLVLRLLGLRASADDPLHSEEELRIILDLSQSAGEMSFRQLLLMENVFDLRTVHVRDAMRPRAACRVLRLDASWEENLAVIRESRLSRFPLVEGDEGKPVGFAHVKDLVLAGAERPDLRRLARPLLTVREDQNLEALLAVLQRRHQHIAIALDAADRWVGVITFEDVIEEVVGTIVDEFEPDPAIFLADGLTRGRVVLGVEADSLEAAVRAAFARVPAAELPVPAGRAAQAVIDRERNMPTLLASGLAAPHARLDEVREFVLVFARSDAGIPVPGRAERARLLFILLAPGRDPRVQLRLLARIAGLLDSEYVIDRLREAETADEVIEVLRAADPGALG